MVVQLDIDGDYMRDRVTLRKASARIDNLRRTESMPSTLKASENFRLQIKH